MRYDGYSKESSSASRVPMHRSRSSDALRMRSTDVGGTSKKKLSGGEHSLCVPPAMEQILSVTRATSTPLGAFRNSTPTTEDTMHSRESLCEEPLDGKLVLDESTEDNQHVISEVDGKSEPPVDEGVHLAEDKTESSVPDGGKRILSADASTYVKNIQSGAEVGGESPLSAIHKRMNSESSNGSTSVVTFPGDCKHQGSDSAFSFTNSSLNTGSRSSSEGISPACEGQEGRLSATGVSPQPRKGPPYDSPKYPHISKEDVPSGKKTSVPRKQSKEDIDMLSLQQKFKELESKVAELDNQVTSLRQVPPFTSSGSQQRPSHFSDLDYQFEKLTSELSILDFLSNDTPTSEGGSIRSVPGFYASGSSKHIHHSVHQKTHQSSKIRKISAPSKSASNSQTQSPSVPCSKSHSQSLSHTRSYSPSGSPQPTLNQNSEPQSSKSSPRASESSEVGTPPIQDDVLMEKGILQHGPERMV